MKRISILFIFLGLSLISFSQKKLHVDINTFALVHSNKDIVPYYQNINKWGLVSPLDKSIFFLQTGASYQLLYHRNIKLKVGLSAVAKNRVDDSFLQEAYVSGKVFEIINFSLGKEAFSPISYDDDLTIGGFLYNSNVRPIPRFTLGIYNYISVPYTNDFLQVRGGISHGILDDNRTGTGKSNSADNILLHEKWAYMKFGKGKIQPYGGLVHSALMGGVRLNSRKVRIDYKASFFAKGSAKLGGGDATNAAGAHEGFWDFGIYTKVGGHKIQVYYQIPFADGSGMKVWTFRNRDFKFGFIADVKDLKWINKISFEILKTDYQSGAGTPDRYYREKYKGHVKGQIVWNKDIKDNLNGFMKTVYNVSPPSGGWTLSKISRYSEIYDDHGYSYGGRDDYDNNGSYYNGWSYYKQNMGCPLDQGYDLAMAYAPNWKAGNFVYFMSTRVKAIHIGVEGEFIPQLKYLFKTTVAKHFGSYGEQYINRSSWIPQAGFIYKGGKTQVYSYLQLVYSPVKYKKIQFNTSFAYDGGQLYNNLGWTIGLSYTPFK